MYSETVWEVFPECNKSCSGKIYPEQEILGYTGTTPTKRELLEYGNPPDRAKVSKQMTVNKCRKNNGKKC